jgi:hypothetical protein
MKKLITALVLLSSLSGYSETVKFGDKTKYLLQSLLSRSGIDQSDVDSCIKQFKDSKADIDTASVTTKKLKDAEGGFSTSYTITGKNSDGKKYKMELTLGEGGDDCSFQEIN